MKAWGLCKRSAAIGCWQYSKPPAALAVCAAPSRRLVVSHLSFVLIMGEEQALNHAARCHPGCMWNMTGAWPKLDFLLTNALLRKVFVPHTFCFTKLNCSLGQGRRPEMREEQLL